MTPVTWPDRFGTAFAKTRVLVTGGAGFIGSHLVSALIDLDAEVIVLDDLSQGRWQNIDSSRQRTGKQLQMVRGSILDLRLLQQLVAGCRWVFHLAALASVPQSVQQPEHYNQVNTTGTLHVLEAARHAGVERVMFAASAAIYGDNDQIPKIETMPPEPMSPYAATKAAGENLARAYAACYSTDTVCLRYFNIFGPRQNPHSAYTAVIAAFMEALSNAKRPVIYGDGGQSRDFTHVDNAVYANLLAARQPNHLGGMALNIACGHRVTVLELATTMAEMAGRSDLIARHEPQRPADVRHSQADLSAAQSAIGYEPILDFRQGLDILLQEHRASREDACQ